MLKRNLLLEIFRLLDNADHLAEVRGEGRLQNPPKDRLAFEIEKKLLLPYSLGCASGQNDAGNHKDKGIRPHATVNKSPHSRLLPYASCLMPAS